MTSSGDDLLVQACGGCRSALGKLLEEHMPPLWTRLGGRIPPRWRALLSPEDVLQQTCADAFLHIDRFKPRAEGAFFAWLCTIADHNLANALEMLEAEKRGGGRRQVGRRSPDDSLTELYELVAVTESTPSRLAARDERRLELEHALRQLPEDYRRVVQMFDLEGQPAKEVAEALDRSPGAVYMMRARAHRWLGELLGSASRLLTTG